MGQRVGQLREARLTTRPSNDEGEFARPTRAFSAIVVRVRAMNHRKTFLPGFFAVRLEAAWQQRDDLLVHALDASKVERDAGRQSSRCTRRCRGAYARQASLQDAPSGVERLDPQSAVMLEQMSSADTVDHIAVSSSTECQVQYQRCGTSCTNRSFLPAGSIASAVLTNP